MTYRARLLSSGESSMRRLFESCAAAIFNFRRYTAGGGAARLHRRRFVREAARQPSLRETCRLLARRRRPVRRAQVDRSVPARPRDEGDPHEQHHCSRRREPGDHDFRPYPLPNGCGRRRQPTERCKRFREDGATTAQVGEMGFRAPVAPPRCHRRRRMPAKLLVVQSSAGTPQPHVHRASRTCSFTTSPFPPAFSVSTNQSTEMAGSSKRANASSASMPSACRPFRKSRSRCSS